MTILTSEQLPEGIVHLGDESLSTVQAAIRLLDQGQTVSIVGRGSSMEPRIPDGTRMVLEPYTHNKKLKKEDVVLAELLFKDTEGELFSYWVMHMIYLVHHEGERVLIGNNHGDIDGWAWDENIFGIYIGAIE